MTTTMTLSDILRFCDAFEIRPGLVSTREVLDAFKEVCKEHLESSSLNTIEDPCGSYQEASTFGGATLGDTLSVGRCCYVHRAAATAIATSPVLVSM